MIVQEITKWEYKTLDLNIAGFWGRRLDALAFDEKLMNHLGEEGWELVSAVSITKTLGATWEIVAIFKRPKMG